MSQLAMKTGTNDFNLDITDFANFSRLPDTCAQQMCLCRCCSERALCDDAHSSDRAVCCVCCVCLDSRAAVFAQCDLILPRSSSHSASGGHVRVYKQLCLCSYKAAAPSHSATSRQARSRIASSQRLKDSEVSTGSFKIRCQTFDFTVAI